MAMYAQAMRSDVEAVNDAVEVGTYNKRSMFKPRIEQPGDRIPGHQHTINS